MDELTIPPREGASRLPDRSPADMPPREARSMLGTAALHLRFASVGNARGLEIVAIADALEELAAGNTEAACEAIRAAEASRRMGAA
jgi:hypothetical protein